MLRLPYESRADYFTIRLVEEVSLFSTNNPSFCNIAKNTSLAEVIPCFSILSFLDTFCLLLLLFAGTAFMTEGRITPGDVVSMVAFFPIWNGFIGHMGFLLRQKPILDNQAERVAVLYRGAEDLSGKDAGAVTEIRAEGLSFSDRKSVV